MTDRKALFFELLVYKLSGEGFRYAKSKNRLVKVIDGNEFIIGYNIWPYFSQVEADYCMLLKEVEDVKKSALGSEYKKFFSVGNSKHDLLPRERFGESTSATLTKEDVLASVEKEIDFYHSFAKGFFAKFSDITYLDYFLNTEPDRYRVVNFNWVDTAILAVIVAKLTGNKNLTELCSFYRQVVEPFPHCLGEFDTIVSYVSGNS